MRRGNRFGGLGGAIKRKIGWGLDGLMVGFMFDLAAWDGQCLGRGFWVW